MLLNDDILEFKEIVTGINHEEYEISDRSPLIKPLNSLYDREN